MILFEVVSGYFDAYSKITIYCRYEKLLYSKTPDSSLIVIKLKC